MFRYLETVDAVTFVHDVWFSFISALALKTLLLGLEEKDLLILITYSPRASGVFGLKKVQNTLQINYLIISLKRPIFLKKMWYAF